MSAPPVPLSFSFFALPTSTVTTSDPVALPSERLKLIVAFPRLVPAATVNVRLVPLPPSVTLASARLLFDASASVSGSPSASAKVRSILPLAFAFLVDEHCPAATVAVGLCLDGVTIGPLTVCGSAAEVLPVKLASPA